MSVIEHSHPEFAAVRAQDPAAYSELRQIVAADLQEGKLSAETFTKIRGVITPFYRKKRDTAPDALVMATASLYADELAYFRNNPKECVAFMYGNDGSLRRSLPPALHQRNAAIDEAIRNATPSAPPVVASQEEFKSATLMALLRIVNESQGSLEQVFAAFAGSGDDKIVCEVRERMLRILATGKAEHNAPVLRALFANRYGN
jgi:hypothetical protein